MAAEIERLKPRVGRQLFPPMPPEVQRSSDALASASAVGEALAASAFSPELRDVANEEGTMKINFDDFR